MKKLLLSLLLFSLTTSVLFAQDKEQPEEKKGFKKENLFTGGSISLSFGNHSFLVGASPVFGYSIANWIDAGVVINYNYTSYRPIDQYGYTAPYKIRQSVYGGGGFVKIYPVKFLFIQGQFEHNFTTQKSKYDDGGPADKINVQSNSLLVGAGYATGRYGAGGQPFFYLAVLFDVLKDQYSPYVDGYGRIIPIIRAGIQVPLFQGGKRNNYEEQEQRGSGSKKPRNYNRY